MTDDKIHDWGNLLCQRMFAQYKSLRSMDWTPQEAMQSVLDHSCETFKSQVEEMTSHTIETITGAVKQSGITDNYSRVQDAELVLRWVKELDTSKNVQDACNLLAEVISAQSWR